jgi:predicted CxxxxCH...CXXCH cytochrome family protein
MKHRTLTLAVLLALAAAALACAGLAARAASSEFGPRQQRRASQARRRAPSNARRPSADYSKFSHATAQHRKACDSCHASPTANWAAAREGGSAFPDVTDYPEHASCINCHRRQFFSGARPAICTVCHTQVSPRSGARFPFENPAELFTKSEKSKTRRTEFSINFPHDRHQDVMARAAPTTDAPRGSDTPAGSAAFVRASFEPRAAEERRVDSCTICHETYQAAGDAPEEYVTKPPAALPTNALGLEAFWLKRGMLKTTPHGHASCFNCHWQDGGERPFSSDCAGCHKLLQPGVGMKSGGAPRRSDADTSNPSVKGIADAYVLARWSVRLVAAFRHEKADHVKVGCTACHISITSADRITSETDFVPIKTCASSSCHGSTNKSAGAKKIIFDEVEQRKKDAAYQCVKCHINLGKEPTPKSHTDLFAK